MSINLAPIILLSKLFEEHDDKKTIMVKKFRCLYIFDIFLKFKDFIKK